MPELQKLDCDGLSLQQSLSFKVLRKKWCPYDLSVLAKMLENGLRINCFLSCIYLYKNYKVVHWYLMKEKI